MGKEKSEYNGVEQYVGECMAKNEIDWFPINRATILDTDAGDDEQKLNVDKIKETLVASHQELRRIKESIDTNLRQSMDKSGAVVDDIAADWDEIKATVEDLAETFSK